MTAGSKQVQDILAALAHAYPDTRCELVYRNPFELLIATILSAQTTDQKVNQIAPAIFSRYPTPQKMLILSPAELEQLIRSIGLFRTKAKNILETCRILVEHYGGQVPNSLEELLKLPGVGRKTAQVVLANAFNIPALPVDTHVLRVANRLGFCRTDDPYKAEQALIALIDKSQWIDTHHRLIAHGRKVCNAKKPRCDICPLAVYCPST